MTAIICRGGRSCSRPATHATLVDYPSPLPDRAAWEPLCWSHAIGDACQVGHEAARFTVTLCSIGYALEDARPLVRYTMLEKLGRQGYEVLA